MIAKILKEEIKQMKRDVEELLYKYQNKETYTDAGEERRWGAIGALEELLEMWSE